MTEQQDWRLMGQERFLMNAVLTAQDYLPAYEGNDHDHCEFCWAKFCDSGLRFGYSTEDRSRWICPQCFQDFRTQFRWSVKE